jgi:hypothetical protein
MKRKRKCRSRDIAQLISLFLYLSLQDDLFLSWKHRIPCLEAWLDREGSKKTDIWMDGWIGMRERVVQSHCIEIIERAFIPPLLNRPSSPHQINGAGVACHGRSRQRKIRIWALYAPRWVEWSCSWRLCGNLITSATRTILVNCTTASPLAKEVDSLTFNNRIDATSFWGKREISWSYLQDFREGQWVSYSRHQPDVSCGDSKCWAHENHANRLATLESVVAVGNRKCWEGIAQSTTSRIISLTRDRSIGGSGGREVFFWRMRLR